MNKPEFLIDAVDNALTVIDMVIENGEVRVRKVSHELHMSPSSAHRLLATLAYRRYLVQDPASKIYRPGSKLLDQVTSGKDFQKLRRIMKPHLENLAEKTLESISVSRLMGDHIEFIDGFESTRVLRASPRIGARLPAHATAGGKVQLAQLSHQDLFDLYPDGLKSITSQTETSLSTLQKQLSLISRRGYAISHEESTEGISAVSVLLQSSHEHPVAALSLLAPTPRLPYTRLRPIIGLLKGVAASVKPLL